MKIKYRIIFIAVGCLMSALAAQAAGQGLGPVIETELSQYRLQNPLCVLKLFLGEEGEEIKAATSVEEVLNSQNFEYKLKWLGKNKTSPDVESKECLNFVIDVDFESGPSDLTYEGKITLISELLAPRGVKNEVMHFLDNNLPLRRKSRRHSASF